MKRLPLIVLLACLTTGCALTTDEVNIQYHSETATNPVPMAQNIIVQVNATEGRTSDFDKVSVKKNGYGMEMAPIISRQPLPDLVKSAIEDELRKEGFKIGPGKIYVDVELDKFYNDFKIGFFSGDAVSEVIITCQVKTRDGQIFYARTAIIKLRKQNGASRHTSSGRHLLV